VREVLDCMGDSMLVNGRPQCKLIVYCYM